MVTKVPDVKDCRLSVEDMGVTGRSYIDGEERKRERDEKWVKKRGDLNRVFTFTVVFLNKTF